MKSFSYWSIEEVENEFGLNPKRNSKQLASWLTIQSSLLDFERQWLTYLRSDLEAYSYTWNEQELIANFIAPLLKLVNFQHEAYRGFLERELSVSYKDETLSGEVDFMVAQGRHSPNRLYFFLHEYKREPEQKDPLGQLMIAMVVAQLLNQDNNPIYGVYIVGRMWYFVLLDGKDYAVHRGFNAASDEIEQIFGILQNTKAIIERLLKIE